jgi:hypothetical protein
MPLPPDLNKPVFQMFPEMADRILRNKCATCQQNIGEFRDEISAKEYGISGMCQECQDSIFQSCEEDYFEEGCE